MVKFIRTLEESTGITHADEKVMWSKWKRLKDGTCESTFRRLMEYELEKMKFELSESIAAGKLNHDDYLKACGALSGIQRALGMFARHDEFR